MRKNYLLIAILACLLAGPMVGVAENMQGTGINSLQIIPDDHGRVVLQAEQDGASIIGSTKAQQNYGELILDQLTSDGQLNPNWGKAEVLLGCYQADVMLYQQQNNAWVEIGAVQIATDYCSQ